MDYQPFLVERVQLLVLSFLCCTKNRNKRGLIKLHNINDLTEIFLGYFKVYKLHESSCLSSMKKALRYNLKSFGVKINQLAQKNHTKSN